MQGLLLFYKPIDWRNKDILKFFQATFGKDIKVGHSGTLDPFAEGLMVMGLGRKFTRQLHDLLLYSQKEYIAVMELGKISDTMDIEGSITDFNRLNTDLEEKKQPALEEIKEIVKKNFTGEQEQIPPIFSAKKHKGKRLRDIADKVEAEEIAKSKVKKVTLYEFEIISYEYPYLEIRLLVSSGFYVRSFGNSLGEKLNTGAYLTKLKRTKLGNFSDKYSLAPNDFQNILELNGKISGEVQGVGFRYFTKELAQRFDISGYIKNTDNNSVEILAQGNLNSLTAFQKQILQSSPVAHSDISYGASPGKISDYSFKIQKPEKIYQNFEIL